MTKFARSFLFIVLLLAGACSSRSGDAPLKSPITSPQTQSLSPSLPFDEFLDEALFAQLRRDPQLLSELGLSGAFGMDDSQLTDVSDAFELQTFDLLQEQLDTLHSYDRAALTPAQQLSYDLFEWDLQDRLCGKEFRFYYYPVKQFLGIHETLLQFMTDRHPLFDLQNAQDYVTRLEGFTARTEQLLEWLQLQQEAGITPPRFVIQRVLGQLSDFLDTAPKENRLYTAFETKVSALDLSEEQKSQLYQQVQQAIQERVIPAYQGLYDYFERLESVAGDDDGWWKHPNGEAAYNYALQHNTTTDMTADEIHALGLQEVDRIQAEMENLLAELGIEGDSLANNMGQVASLSGVVEREDVVDEYTALLERAQQNLSDLFDLPFLAEVVVWPVESPGDANGYYVQGAFDGSRPGVFYANLARDTYRYNMPTLTYHEAIPGHHLQGAVQQQLTDLPAFRQGNFYTAYDEGWALYAERLAWEAGFYEGDPYGNLGRLQAELFRAARLVVDTGIHAQGWTRQQAIEYMVTNVGLPEDDVTAEVERYIVFPGQATAYKIGMLKILELRQCAQQALGAAFDIKEFHNVILKGGAMPLDILERVVDDYIEAALQ